jgi:glycosyltransferase involved in cell wall biosynthesis
MKIGIDARNLYHPILKGIGIYLQNLLPHLAALDGGHEYVLFYDSRNPFTRRLPKESAISDQALEVQRGDTLYFWEQLGLPRKVQSLSIDLFHSAANTTFLYGRCPRVVTVHDTKALEMRSDNARASIYNRNIQPYALKKAARIICDSAFTKRRLLERVALDPDKVDVVYLGIGDSFHVIEDPGPICATLNKFQLARPFILFAGGESAPKNISNLIKAFGMLRQSGSRVTLVIPGIRSEQILKHHQSEAVAYRVDDSVLFPGYVTEQELLHLYNAAELLVYPSLWEGFGFPPLEAMACGLPVAASNATSIPEVVGDAGVLFDGTKPPDIAEKLHLLLANPALRAELRDKGFKRIRTFVWDKTAAQTLAIYHACLPRC